ncbi:MAG: hypothetical protein ACE5IY_15920 [bacterium]
MILSFGALFYLPRLEAYDSTGEWCDEIVHHPAYVQAGNIIYGSGMMEKVSQPGNLLESLALFFLSSHAGEAGHNCPVACTAGVRRIFRRNHSIWKNSSILAMKQTLQAHSL